MDSFELNKIIGAILGTLLFVMGVGFLAEAIYTPIEGRGPGYALPEPEGTEHAGGEPAAAVAAVPLGTLLASADPAQGATTARKCQSCHNFAQGAGNKQGPELYGVVGRPIGSHEGFSYSDGMLAHKAAGDTWTYENLNAFLTSPKTFTPGTKMTFAGIKNDAERANVIAYLATISPGAPAFPAPDAAPASGTAPAPEGTVPVATDANAVATPTTTGTETQVEGTPAEAPAPTPAPAQ